MYRHRVHGIYVDTSVFLIFCIYKVKPPTENLLKIGTDNFINQRLYGWITFY